MRKEIASTAAILSIAAPGPANAAASHPHKITVQECNTRTIPNGERQVCETDTLVAKKTGEFAVRRTDIDTKTTTHSLDNGVATTTTREYEVIKTFGRHHNLIGVDVKVFPSHTVSIGPAPSEPGVEIGDANHV